MACQVIGAVASLPSLVLLSSGFARRPQEGALESAVFGFGLLLVGVPLPCLSARSFDYASRQLTYVTVPDVSPRIKASALPTTRTAAAAPIHNGRGS